MIVHSWATKINHLRLRVMRMMCLKKSNKSKNKQILPIKRQIMKAPRGTVNLLAKKNQHPIQMPC